MSAEDAKIIAATPYSKGDKTENPIRFAVGRYKKGTNPHEYVVGMQVKRNPGNIVFISTAHYHLESEAMNRMLWLIARHNEGHTDKWISYIPPTVKRVG
jgi:hypothetical protein